jgi:hypothetical protein
MSSVSHLCMSNCLGAGLISYRSMGNYAVDTEQQRSLRSQNSPERSAAMAERRALQQARLCEYKHTSVNTSTPPERDADQQRKETECSL